MSSTKTAMTVQEIHNVYAMDPHAGSGRPRQAVEAAAAKAAKPAARKPAKARAADAPAK